MLDYEKLDVYRTGLEFVITTIEIRDRLPGRVVKKGSVVSILRVLTKQGGDDEKTGSVSSTRLSSPKSEIH
jgi:hypothetical protein